ncbi:MAG TPA: FAD-dependent oxidoreductase [Alphaproteobacteria bacterium]
MSSYVHPVFAYRRCADHGASRPARHPVVIVGGGMVGLTAALDLAQRGVRVVLIDEDDTVSTGSRSICQAKRSLEIWDRLGCAEPMMQKGVTWQVGRVFFRDREIFNFDLLPEGGHRYPAFINLQQYYVEQFLVERLEQTRGVELRWKNKLVGLVSGDGGVRLTVDTPDGPYEMDADWVIAADGARSTVRRLLGLEFKGRVFEDRFLIADVRMKTPPFGRTGPTERLFWFEPPFHRGDSALLHRQADEVYRIDFQLGPTADPELERQPERVIPRLKAMLGEAAAFEFEWVSVYTFQCRRLAKFRHGRVIFAGDAAHQVSPFGARGGNSGIQDADNLCWKLALVIGGQSPERLLDSYDDERSQAADENILITTRSTDFMTPCTATSRRFRDAVLKLAEAHPFARRLVNSGRLSAATALADSPLCTPDEPGFRTSSMAPGTAAADAPVRIGNRRAWLLEMLRGGDFHGLYFADGPLAAATAAALRDFGAADVPVHMLAVTSAAGTSVRDVPTVVDCDGLVAGRYDGRPGTFYLLRPDHHVAARWRRLDPAAIHAALQRATARA